MPQSSRLEKDREGEKLPKAKNAEREGKSWNQLIGCLVDTLLCRRLVADTQVEKRRGDERQTSASAGDALDWVGVESG